MLHKEIVHTQHSKCLTWVHIYETCLYQNSNNISFRKARLCRWTAAFWLGFKCTCSTDSKFDIVCTACCNRALASWTDLLVTNVLLVCSDHLWSVMWILMLEQSLCTCNSAHVTCFSAHVTCLQELLRPSAKNYVVHFLGMEPVPKCEGVEAVRGPIRVSGVQEWWRVLCCLVSTYMCVLNIL